MSKQMKKSQKVARRRFDDHRTDALAWACEGSRFLIITGHDNHCVRRLAKMLTALEGELDKMSAGERVPTSRALLVSASRSRHDSVSEPHLRLAAMLGEIGRGLALLGTSSSGALKAARERLADLIAIHAQAILLMADLNAERERTNAAA